MVGGSVFGNYLSKPGSDSNTLFSDAESLERVIAQQHGTITAGANPAVVGGRWQGKVPTLAPAHVGNCPINVAVGDQVADAVANGNDNLASLPAC